VGESAISDRIELTPEQAISMLADDDSIHTFRSAGPMLLGCDWDRDKLLQAIRENKCELGGEGCRGMNHGLAVNVDGWLFVECKSGFDYDAFEKQIASGAPVLRGSHIEATGHHDVGAYAKCSYCGRYSDNPRALQYDPRGPELETDVRCDCGKTRGWCGSFSPPTADSLWSA
jgi:hypothetical protein